jgi:DNA-binding beta-propeller fold protein YncE
MTDRVFFVAAALACAACGSSGGDLPGPVCPAAAPARLVVTADWLNRSLTLLDYARVTNAACSEKDAIVGTIDLQAYSPGPLALALTPDGKRALVSVSAGFFAAVKITSDPIPPGGALLVVDLESRKVVHEVKTPTVPFGVAVSPDGKLGFSANWGNTTTVGDTISKIDLASGKSVADVKVGPHPEELAVSADGSVGMVALDDEGGVRLFTTADPQDTLSPVVKTGADPSGMAFVGNGSALVTNSIGFSYSVLDVSGATAKVRATQTVKGRSPYGASVIPGTSKVIVTAFLGTTNLIIVDTATSPPSEEEPIELEGKAFPLTAAVDRQGAFAFVAHASDHALSVVDLRTRAVRTLRWLDKAGPTYVAVQP